MGIGACGTAKAGSGYPASLLAIRDATTKQKNWGLEAHTGVDNVLCMTWVDMNTVQLMTTAYNASDISTPYFLPPRRRHGIPENSIQTIPLPYLPSVVAHTTLFCSLYGGLLRQTELWFEIARVGSTGIDIKRSFLKSVALMW